MRKVFNMRKVFIALGIIVLLGVGTYFAGSYFSGDRNRGREGFNHRQTNEKLNLSNIEGVPQESPTLQGRVVSMGDGYLVVSEFNPHNFNGDNSSNQKPSRFE